MLEFNLEGMIIVERFFHRLTVIVLVLSGVIAEAQIPIDTSYTVASTLKKLSKNYPHIQPAVIEPGTVSEFADVVYFTIPETEFGKRNLHADLFIPNRSNALFPAIIMIHGGGWRSGNKSLNTSMARALAVKGFVVVSVEYRLSLEAKYPAAVHDILNAIRWTKENGHQYQIDTMKIALAGYSAGGQLASLIGVAKGDEPFMDDVSNKSSIEVQAVIDLDGLLDFTNPESLAVRRTGNSADVFWLEGTYDQIPERWKEASPLTWVQGNSPPFLFINSSQTRFHAGCADMVQRLDDLGIYNEVHKLEGAPHSFWFFHPWFDQTIAYISSFLNKVFHVQRG